MYEIKNKNKNKTFMEKRTKRKIQSKFPLMTFLQIYTTVISSNKKLHKTYGLSTLPGKTPAQQKSCPCIALTLRAGLPLLSDSHILLLYLEKSSFRKCFLLCYRLYPSGYNEKKSFLPSLIFLLHISSNLKQTSEMPHRLIPFS